MTLQPAPGPVDVRPPPAAVRMNAGERRATASLASIYGLRLLGMFVILPVFALYAETLEGGASHTMIGIALGAYGLTQAILQIPFGWASDRWGRKPVIYAGLAIFAVGSFIAASVWSRCGRRRPLGAVPSARRSVAFRGQRYRFHDTS